VKKFPDQRTKTQKWTNAQVFMNTLVRSCRLTDLFEQVASVKGAEHFRPASTTRGGGQILAMTGRD
jgi:hypothetical protein